MKLKDLGFNEGLEKHRKTNDLSDFEIGRVIAEHKERYVVMTASGEFESEITGHLRYTAKSREDFPAVGDWVALTIFEPDMAIVHKILPRSSILKRQAVGQMGAVQVIATNIDTAFIVQAVDRDFNINRIERYLAICYSSKVNPVIILTKTDLLDEKGASTLKDQVQARVKDVPVIAISNITRDGYEAIRETIEKGKTYCLLGSSGVGKSTLLNNLSGTPAMKTGAISTSSGKGKHVTSHRELTILSNGGLLIDNPGMREVGIADASDGLETTFDAILGLSQSCKFKDCTHTTETGCSILEALKNGEIDRASYENYLKMEREKAHFEASVAERRKKEKQFGKIMKNYKKDIKKM
jgi:ribosome biogenesis GTPase